MTEEKLQELLASLSVQEKIGQLIQVPGSTLQADGQELGVRDELGISGEMIRNAGSTLNVVGAEQIRSVQEAYLKQSRHKIPLLFMADIIYGFRTVFPIPLALGCSFEPEFIKRMSAAVSRESTAAGVHVTFSPMADLVRDGRWGRVLESTGEDPYLNSRFTENFVEGFQQGLEEEGAGRGMASCVKHFAAYGAPEGGRDYNTVDMSERRLRQDYLPSYRAGVEAGCEMVMTSFNTVDGVPSTGNKWLMKDVLRGEWGFQGVVITDYAAIAELIAHGVAADKKEAARMAMEACVDIDMCTDCYANHLEELLGEGTITREQLDEAVLRVLRLKNKLGLFEDPFRGADAAREQEVFFSEEILAMARQAAVKSMVLLENREELLPLTFAQKQESRIALIGPFAHNQNALGMWAIHGDRSRVVTLKDALTEVVGGRLTCLEGCEALLPEDYTDLPVLQESRNQMAWSMIRRLEEMEQAVRAAEEADLTILALGEDEVLGGEGGSRTSLGLPGDQLELLRRVRETAQKLVVVVFAGRPLVLDEVKELADALLLVWYPGTEGGHAVADVLFGVSAPEGRLSMSLPRSVGQMPLYYNCFSTGRPYDGVTPIRFFSRYTDCPNTPLYPFGYGLSYHKAQYGPTRLDRDKLHAGETLTVSAQITNTAARGGVETVQLYIQDVTGSVVRPVKELKGVVKVFLKPGETRQISFEVTEEMLQFCTREREWKSEPGLFRAVVAPDSSSVPEAEFTLC